MKSNTIAKDGKKVISTELKGIEKLNKTINKNFEKAVELSQELKEE